MTETPWDSVYPEFIGWPAWIALAILLCACLPFAWAFICYSARINMPTMGGPLGSPPDEEFVRLAIPFASLYAAITFVISYFLMRF